MTIIYFLIALGVLVVVHEWGHFIMARLGGIRVPKFSIGFGPRLAGFKWGQTEYRISLIPLGGYVQLHGLDEAMVPKEEGVTPAEVVHDPDSFVVASYPRKMATVFGGPVMNFVLAFLLMPVVFMVGRSSPAILEKAPVILGIEKDSPAEVAGFLKGDRLIAVDGKNLETWNDVVSWVMIHADTKANVTIERNQEKLTLPLSLSHIDKAGHTAGYSGFEPFRFWGDDPIIGEVSGSSPAQVAGLEAMDKITEINGAPVSSWTEMTEKIRGSLGKEINLTIVRNGSVLTKTIVPAWNESAKAYLIGVGKYQNPADLVKKQYGFVESISKGIEENIRLYGLTFDVLGRLFSFQLSYKSLGGPIQIAQASAAAAQSGLGDFLFLVCFLSIQLGIMNLLPVPVLDGGQAVLMTLEKVVGRAFSPRFKEIIQQVSMVLLLSLMAVVTFNDLKNLLSGQSWFVHLLQRFHH